MCIIIAKDKSDRLPTRRELENCFRRNPDGAGFMYTKGGRVVIDKGYMTAEAFLNRFEHLCSKYDGFKDKALVIHCRIGTAGTNSAKNTHPYPISSSLKKLHKTYTTCSIGIAHNGIITDYNPPKGDAQDTNDTQRFISTYLAALQRGYNKFYKDDDILEAIEILSGSKFAILTKDDELVTIGDFTEEDGLLFSNSTYKDYTYTSSAAYNWRDWYYEDDDMWATWNASTQAEREHINYDNLIDVPTTYYIEYDGEVHQSRDDYYCIDIESEALYIYDEDLGDYRSVSYDYTLYDEDFEPVGSLSEWLA